MKIYKNTDVAPSRVEKWLLIPIAFCFGLMFIGMALYCLTIGEAREALMLLGIVACFVVTFYFAVQTQPYLGIGEDCIAVFSGWKGRKMREIPFEKVAFVQESYHNRMRTICICLREGWNEVNVPYHSEAMKELTRLGEGRGWLKC